MLRFFQKQLHVNYVVLAMSLFISPFIHAYDYSDNQSYSQSPPDKIPSNKAPLFVSIGFDDNSVSGIAGSGGTGGMTWILDFLRNKKNQTGLGNSLTYDSTPARVSFFNTSKYQEKEIVDNSVFVKRAWNKALNDGHEIGVHTVNHEHGKAFSVTKWRSEIGDALKHLSKPFNPNEQPENPIQNSGMGVDREKITGFRTPFLEYNDNTFSRAIGFKLNQ